MHLPNELVITVLQDLERSDLKSARLVSKTWCSYASTFLFDRIFVAPNKLDLEVFNAITRHPTLSKCVRHLIYDGCEFVSLLTKESYVKDLWSQAHLGPRADLIEYSLNRPDSQINDWMRDVKPPNQWLFDEIFTKWKDRSLITDGYKIYREHSDYQRKALGSGEFIETLVQGLSSLISLESVTLEGSWLHHVGRDGGVYRIGTPLARTWNHFHCYPHSWLWNPERDSEDEVPDGTRHYWIITTALVRTQRRLKAFTIGANSRVGISPEVYQRIDPLLPNALGLDIAALSGIERLQLRFATCFEDAAAPEYCDSIEGLPKLLGSLHSLKSLELQLPDTFRDSICLYNYDQVFPKTMRWDHLKDFALFHSASNATDLIRLLLIQMPNLENLNFGDLQLLQGCWKSVIECLKQFNRLRTFGIGDESALYQHDEEILECDNQDIEEYIMRGGRHPLLLEGQPESASEDFISKLEASIRDSLLEMERSRTQMIRRPEDTMPRVEDPSREDRSLKWW